LFPKQKYPQCNRRHRRQCDNSQRPIFFPHCVKVLPPSRPVCSLAVVSQRNIRGSPGAYVKVYGHSFCRPLRSCFQSSLQASSTPACLRAPGSLSPRARPAPELGTKRQQGRFRSVQWDSARRGGTVLRTLARMSEPVLLIRLYVPHQMRRRSMAKRKQTARGRKQDRARVAGRQRYEVSYEAKKTGASAKWVKRAVKRVGNSRKKVERRLAR
jgi:hypothetical protein